MMMRLAISNIAWDTVEDEQLAELLVRHGVDAIDIAPGKYFADPLNTSTGEARAVRQWWADHGIEITGMQALLFGTKGLNVFGDASSQRNLLAHLAAVFRIGSELGAVRLVFGSPRNRDRTGLSDDEALSQAVSFFRRAGDIAEEAGVVLCLEPNPVCYGANFMTNSIDTAKVVRAVDHSAIRMQLDIGSVSINGENIEAVLGDCADIISHIHASEPELATLGDMNTAHEEIGRAIAQQLPNAIVCIEMLAARSEPHLIAVERALTVAHKAYRSSCEG